MHILVLYMQYTACIHSIVNVLVLFMQYTAFPCPINVVYYLYRWYTAFPYATHVLHMYCMCCTHNILHLLVSCMQYTTCTHSVNSFIRVVHYLYTQYTVRESYPSKFIFFVGVYIVYQTCTGLHSALVLCSKNRTFCSALMDLC